MRSFRLKAWVNEFRLSVGTFFLSTFLLCGPSCSKSVPHSPVQSQRGMVVSSSVWASDVGISILRRGGHAVDAAVATGFALAVVHPAAGNLGGGGFMVIRDKNTAQETTVDYREMAPSAAYREMYLDGQGGLREDLSRSGYLASGVPGSVAGMHRAWRKFGKLPWRELVEPAVELARNGFSVNLELSQSLLRSADLLRLFPESRRIFLRDGDFYKPGEVLRQPDLARTLQQIALHGPESFYEGEIAHLIDVHMRDNRGNITLQDLKNYVPKIREPIRVTYRGYDIVSMGPPSSGGIVLGEMLNMIELFPLGEMGHGSTETVHLMAEVMRRAFADRTVFLGDTDFSPLNTEELIKKTYAHRRIKDFRPDQSTPSDDILETRIVKEAAQTTHYSVVDAEGNAVATTTTINGSFGSGVTIPGAGFLMNNEMDDFSSKPGLANMFGLIQSDANAIEPYKRPLSSMTPTLARKRNGPVLVLGSPGGPRIISTVFQVLLNVIDHNMGIQQAVDAPRIHHQSWPDEILAEPAALSSTVESDLRKKGHCISYRDRIGDAQAILIDPETGMRLGAPDPRHEGSAKGY